MSFLVLPGLDACPPDETVAISLDEPGTAVEGVVAAAGGENSSRGLQLLASSARGMLSSSQAGAGIMEDVPGFASAGGDFDFGGGDEDGGSCFEGSNVLGSVRTILQVGRAGDRYICFKMLHVRLNSFFASPSTTVFYIKRAVFLCCLDILDCSRGSPNNVVRGFKYNFRSSLFWFISSVPVVIGNGVQWFLKPAPVVESR